MDYSKTHYYKFSNSATTTSRKSTIPSFERDDMPVTYGNNTRVAQQNSQRTTDNTPAAPGFGPAGSVTPTLPDDNDTDNTPAVPGFGPVGPVTPSLPSENDTDTSFAPGFGPEGDVMPTLPPSGSITTPSQPSTGNTNILWSWAFLSPIFSNISSVAQARFYNVAAIQEPLDIYMNGQLIVSDLDYSEYTDYLYIIPGYYNLTVYRRTNPDVPIINARVSFARNSTCTVSILGDMNGFSLQFIC